MENTSLTIGFANKQSDSKERPLTLSWGLHCHRHQPEGTVMYILANHQVFSLHSSSKIYPMILPLVPSNGTQRSVRDLGKKSNYQALSHIAGILGLEDYLLHWDIIPERYFSSSLSRLVSAYVSHKSIYLCACCENYLIGHYLPSRSQIVFVLLFACDKSVWC